MDAIKEPVLVSIGSAVCVVLALYLYVRSSSKRYDIWEKKGIPYIKPKPFFSSMLEKFQKQLHKIELDRYKKYGRLYGYFEGSSVALSVADPDLIRRIFVKDYQIVKHRSRKSGDRIHDKMLPRLEGEDWKRVRTIISPTFTIGKIRKMMSIFTSCSKATVVNLTKHVEKGEAVNVKKIYSAFTLDTIAGAAFSTKLDSYNDSGNEFHTAASEVFYTKINLRYVFSLLLNRLMKFLKLPPMFPNRGIKFYSDVAMRIIKERQRTGETRNDYLQLLMEASDELNSEHDNVEKSDVMLQNYETDTNNKVFMNNKFKKALTNDEMVAQCVLFLLAGFENTAWNLSYASYYLALNPDVQDKLVEEIDEAVRKSNGELTFEAIQSMKYLDNVISETLRINSTSLRFERITVEDYKLGDTGIVVPKNTIITIPLYAMLHDPEFFPDPEKFDPDRFLPTERALRNPYTFTVFGAGPRNCVGMRFALMEIKVCLAYVLCHFEIKRCMKTKVPLEYHMDNRALRPKEITLRMVPRECVLLRD